MCDRRFGGIFVCRNYNFCDNRHAPVCEDRFVINKEYCMSNQTVNDCLVFQYNQIIFIIIYLLEALRGRVFESR